MYVGLQGVFVWTPDVIPPGHTNLTENERLQLLDKLSYETFINLLPNVIFVLVLIAIGVPGNSLVFYVYLKLFKPSAMRVFVLALAFFDLLINVVSLPRHILLMRFTHRSHGLLYCRFLNTLASLPVFLSYWLLAFVALERRHRICNPFQEHLSPRHATTLLAVLVLLTALTIFPFAALQEEGPFPTGYPEVLGIACKLPRDYYGFDLKKTYALTLTLSYAFILMVLVFSYCQIFWKVHLVKQKLEHHQLRHMMQSSTSRPSVQQTTVPSVPSVAKMATPDLESSSVDPYIRGSSNSYAQDSGQLGAISSTRTFSSDVVRMSETPRRETVTPLSTTHTAPSSQQHPTGLVSRTTVMMFVLTIVTVVCCVPYFALELSHLHYFGKDISPRTMNFRFLLRVFPSVNSVINPFIYNWFNEKFREKSNRVLHKLRNKFCSGH